CLHDGGDGRVQRLGGTAGDSNPGLGVEPAAVKLLRLQGDLLAQFRYTGHGRILVAPFAHVPRQRLVQLGRSVEVGEALAEVDGAMPCGQLRHDGEDGGADVRQLDADLHGHVPFSVYSGSTSRATAFGSMARTSSARARSTSR